MLPLFFHGRCVFTCTPFINQHMSELFARKQSNCQHERPWKRDTCDVRAHTHQLFPYRVNVHQQSVPGAGDAAVDQTDRLRALSACTLQRFLGAFSPSSSGSRPVCDIPCVPPAFGNTALSQWARQCAFSLGRAPPWFEVRGLRRRTC